MNFGAFRSFGKKIKKSKMADPRWPPFENITLFLRYMTSPAHVVDLKGNIVGHIICRLSFVVIALIFSALNAPHHPSGPRRPKMAVPNRVKILKVF